MNVGGLFQGLAVVSGLIMVGIIALIVVQSSRGVKIKNGMTLIAFFLVLTVVMATLGAGIVFIRPDEVGVVISYISPKGYRDAPLTSGIHLIVPYAESVQIYSIAKETYTMSSTANEGQVAGNDAILARTMDGQQINLDASVIFEIDPAKAVQVHIQWQHRYEDDLVRTQSRGIIREAVSQYAVEEAVSTKRTELTSYITNALTKKLSDNGLILVDFVLRNITFSPEYAASVEQKQIAQQQAEQAKFVVEQRKQEAEQARQQAQGLADSAVIRAKGDADARVIQAQAEAQALQLIASALKSNPDLLTYQYITKLSPGIQVMLVPNNSPYLLPLPTLGPAAPTTAATDIPTPAAPTPAPTPAPTTTP